MKRRRALAVAALVIVAVVSCVGVASYYMTMSWWSGEIDNRTVIVRVVDERGGAVQGATVALPERSAYRYAEGTMPATDSTGEVALSTMAGPVGGHEWHLFFLFRMGSPKHSYWVRVSAQGFPAERNIELIPDERSVYTVILER
jgi:hypothetical protein